MKKTLKVLPTMATVLAIAVSLARDPDSGINWVMVVNGEQGFHAASSAGGARHVDRPNAHRRGDRQRRRQRRAPPHRARNHRQGDGAPVATVTQTIFCRGDGGFGGPPRRRRRRIRFRRARRTWCAISARARKWR
jgi:hypothetical protein